MTVVTNARLVTRNPDCPFIENGAIAWENSLIEAIGTSAELKEIYPHAHFLDACGAVVMPGLINMHHHIYSAFGRGMTLKEYSPRNFTDILKGLWWHLDRNLSLEDCLQAARFVYADCIKNGVTTVFDHHASFGAIEGSLDQLSHAATESGIKTCLCYEASDRDGEEKAEQSIAENERFIKKIASQDDDMQYAMMGLHASFTLSNKTLEKCVDVARSNDVGCHIHVAEDKADLADSLQKYNKPVVKRLHKAGIPAKKSLAVHCIHIFDEELEILKDTRTAVVHNPQSNMGNAVGTPDILKIFNAGILSGLGTDGYTGDIMQSYKTANEICKHRSGNPNVGWSEIPTMLFQNNAKMANRYFKTPTGILKKGYAADIIITDYVPPTPLHEGNINGHLLFGTDGRSVVTTIINGKILMENRRFTHIDEEAILAHTRECAGKLWQRL
ncbi:MAG: putative aminohydrolase SsnA [Spirochaetales bacterium]